MSLQQRIEASPYGRAIISGFVVFLLLAVALWNLPPSHLQTVASKTVRPVVDGVGLDQGWGMFAPDPRPESIDFVARIDYADGTSAEWRPPAQGRYLEPYRSYRWWKWVENVHDDQAEGYWTPTALWIARQHRDRQPISVTLIRRWQPTPPVAVKDPQPWQQYPFFTLDVTPEMLS